MANPAGFNPDEFLKQTTASSVPIEKEKEESEGEVEQRELNPTGFSPDAFLGADKPLSPSPQIAGEEDAPFDFGKELREQVDAVKAGIQEAIDPFSLVSNTQKEYEEKRDVGDTITQTVANIGTGIAVGAGAAAAAVAATGAAVPAAVASVGGMVVYGLYSGMGREYLRSNKENIEFSPIRGAAYSAFEINPLIKGGSKLNKIMRGTAQAVGEGATEYSIKGDVEGAAATGGVTAAGLAITAVLGHGAAKLASKAGGASPSAKNFDDLNELITDKDGKIVKETQKEIASLSDADFRKLDDDDTFKLWVRDGNGTKLDEDFNAQWNQLSEEARQEARELFMWGKIAQQKASRAVGEMDNTIRKRGSTTRSVREPFGFIGEWMRDGLFISRSIDRATGGNTNFVTALNNMSEARNVFENTTGAFHKRAEKLAEQSKALGVSDDDMGRILAGKMDVPEKAEEVVKGWRNIFRDLKNEMHNHGFKINELEDYFPNRSLKKDGLATALRRKSEEVQPVMERIGAKDLDDITVEKLMRSGMSEELAIESAKAASDLKRVTRRAQGLGDEESVTMDLVDDAIETSLRPGKSRASSTISAMFERKGDTPEFIRNYNVIDVYQSYVRSNLKAAIMHKPLENIRAQTAILDGLGMTDSAKWMHQYIRHAKGEQTGAVALWNTSINKARFYADRIFDDESATFGQRTLARGARIGPELLARAGTFPYPAYLGLNMKAHVRNMAQNFLTTAPELGGLYGQQVVTRGMARAAKDKTVGGENMTQFLRERGLLGDFKRLESLDKPTMTAGMGKHLETANEALMWSYGQTETINRYWAVKAADILVEDLLKKKPAAMKALNNMDVGTARGLDLTKGVKEAPVDIRKLLEQGDEEAVKKRVRDWMISKALFNYGPEQNAQFSRHFGPMFSMFTKWPIMISSDIHDIFTKDKTVPAAIKFTTKYMAPLFALQAADAALEDVKKEPMMKYTLGDLSKMSPIHSVEGLKDLGRGPLVKAVLSVPVGAVKVAGAQDKGKALKSAAGDAVEGVLSTYVPPVSTIMNEIQRAEKAGVLSKDMRSFTPRGVREELGLKKER